MRWAPAFLVFIILLSLPVVVSGETVIKMEEDTSFQTDETALELFGFDNETTVVFKASDDHMSVEIIDGFLNFTPEDDWHGSTLVLLTFDDNGNITVEEIVINVSNVNDAPVINEILLNGDPANLLNPVIIELNYSDIDEDPMDITWYLDDEGIGKDVTFQRYIYPDQNNLTVIIDDGNGGTDTMTLTIHTIPPKGWGDEPDNTRNRIIFWIIFGTAGMILLAAMVWVLFRPEGRNKDGPDPAKGK